MTFKEIYKKEKDYVKNLCNGIYYRDKDMYDITWQPEDIMQQAWINFYIKLHIYKKELGSPRTFLNMMIANAIKTARTTSATKKRRKQVSLDYLIENNIPIPNKKPIFKKKIYKGRRI